MLIDWDKLAYPYLDPEPPVLDAVLQRPRPTASTSSCVAGGVVYEGGRFTRIDRDAALRELHDSLRHALAGDEIERRCQALPHVRHFYAGYFDPEAHVPYYGPSSRA